MRLIQYVTTNGKRRVGRSDLDSVVPLRGWQSIRDLAREAIGSGQSLTDLVPTVQTDQSVDMDRLLEEKRLLPPVDHPDDPAHFQITGTGLTHMKSAEARDEFHEKDPDEMSDSEEMYQIGLEGGRPDPGEIGAQPEWFYKGTGHILVPPEQGLPLDDFALDGGEEVEVCGLYIIDPEGRPCRIGFALGNEFSDHELEQSNYLYLAHSKLRPCSIGPELLVGELPESISGTTRIRRDGEIIWEDEFQSGEEHMCHSIRNLDHHQFKYDQFRQPGDLHAHFFGTPVISYADGIDTRIGDQFELEASPFGRPLRNKIIPGTSVDQPIDVRTL